MSQLIFSVPTWTPVVVGSAANFTDGGHVSLQGGSATQLTCITDISLGGLAGSAAPMILMLARDSTVGASLTALADPNSNGPKHPATAALAAPAVGFVASTTKPQRSSSTSLGKLSLPFNAFGGQLRWVAPPKGEFWILGNTASAGEVSLSWSAPEEAGASCR